MKRLVTNALFCFLHPLFLLSSFCILDFNNKIRPDRRTDRRTDTGRKIRPDKRTNGHTEGLQNRPRRLPVQNVVSDRRTHQVTLYIRFVLNVRKRARFALNVPDRCRRRLLAQRIRGWWTPIVDDRERKGSRFFVPNASIGEYASIDSLRLHISSHVIAFTKGNERFLNSHLNWDEM